MKITIVSDVFPLEPNPLAIRYWHLAKALSAGQHDVHLIHPLSASSNTYQMVHISDAQTTMQNILRDPPERLLGRIRSSKLRKLWKSEQPDCIIITTEGPLGQNAQKAALSRNIQTISVFQSYGKKLDFDKLKGGQLRQLRNFHNRSDLCLVPNKHSKGILTDAGFNHLKILPYGIDFATYHSDLRSDERRKQWAADEDSSVIIHHSTFDDPSELELALQVFQKIQELEPKATLVLIGDGPLLKKIKQNHPQHHYLNPISPEDCASAYASGDVLISTNTSNPLSHIECQAMACGLLVLGYQYGILKELIDNGENGFVVKAKQSDRLIETVETLINANPVWPILRESAQRKVRQFEFCNIAKQLLKLIFQ